jgi:hypothetical protein
MAQSHTIVSTLRARQSFQGWFSEMWKVRATIDDMNATAATAIGEWDLAVDGLALGDMVLFYSININQDDGTDQAMTSCYVASANLLTFQVKADDGAFILDHWNAGIFRAVIGRPNW